MRLIIPRLKATCQRSFFSLAMKPLLSQQGQGDAAGQQSLAEGVLGDGRPEPVAALCQGLEGAGRGMHAVVAGVLSAGPAVLGNKQHILRSNGLNALVDTEPVFLSDLQNQISIFHHQLYPFPARDTGWAVNPRLLACFMTMAWRPLNHNSVSFCRRQFGDWKGRPMFLGNYLDVIAIGRGIPISGFTFYIKKHLTS